MSACPACPVAPADGTGVAPADGTGVGPADGTGVANSICADSHVSEK